MRKETTIEKVWRYLSELAEKNQCNRVRVAMGEIAQNVNRSERMVQLVMHQLVGKIERVFHIKQGIKHKTKYKNEINEYIVHTYFTHAKQNEISEISPIKNLKAFKDLKDLKAEEEKISTSHNASPEIHKIKKSASNDLPDIIKRNLPHLVQGHALTVVDYVLAKFKRRMHKITHLVSWIRGALANEQAIYDAIGFEKYKNRGAKADRNKSDSTSTSKSKFSSNLVPSNRTSNRTSNRPSNRPSRPSLPMPVYESPVVEQSDVERILAKAKLYEKEKDRLISAV